MTDEALTLTLPAPLAQELRAATQDFLVDLLARGLREVKVERALDRYACGGMSFGAAAQQAGVSQGDLARYAYARGMEPPFSAQTLAEELVRLGADAPKVSHCEEGDSPTKQSQPGT